MAKSKNDVLQGTLDLLVLKTLQRGPLHGYGIASHIARISDELLRVASTFGPKIGGVRGPAHFPCVPVPPA